MPSFVSVSQRSKIRHSGFRRGYTPICQDPENYELITYFVVPLSKSREALIYSSELLNQQNL